MSPENTSTRPPSIDNPVGDRILITSCISFALVVLFVVLRLLGRWRQRQRSPTLGESHHYVGWSDLTIVVALLNTAALLGIIIDGVKWGQGLHSSQLSQVEKYNTLKAFFLYQIVYKFASGISKIATCFILLAIASPHQRAFIYFCRGLAVFILGYCVVCSIVTIFQCGTDFDSNWIHSSNRRHCFKKAPFWYAHASLNILASIVVAILPWWLFSGLTYKRKYVIGVMLTGLALGEVIFGAVRMRGVYQSLNSASDPTYGTSTGVIASQLEVSFACIAACVPTVIKICEELYVFFCARILRLDHSGSHTGGSHTGYGLSSLDRSGSKHTVPRRSKIYTGGGVEEYEQDIERCCSRNSRECIIHSGDFTVKKEFHVSSDDASLSVISSTTR